MRRRSPEVRRSVNGFSVRDAVQELSQLGVVKIHHAQGRAGLGVTVQPVPGFAARGRPVEARLDGVGMGVGNGPDLGRVPEDKTVIRIDPPPDGRAGLGSGGQEAENQEQNEGVTQQGHGGPESN